MTEEEKDRHRQSWLTHQAVCADDATEVPKAHENTEWGWSPYCRWIRLHEVSESWARPWGISRILTSRVGWQERPGWRMGRDNKVWKHSWYFKENWDESHEMSVVGAETGKTAGLMCQQNVNILLSLYFIDFWGFGGAFKQDFFFFHEKRKKKSECIEFSRTRVKRGKLVCSQVCTHSPCWCISPRWAENAERWSILKLQSTKVWFKQKTLTWKRISLLHSIFAMLVSTNDFLCHKLTWPLRQWTFLVESDS